MGCWSVCQTLLSHAHNSPLKSQTGWRRRWSSSSWLWGLDGDWWLVMMMVFFINQGDHYHQMPAKQLKATLADQTFNILSLCFMSWLWRMRWHWWVAGFLMSVSVTRLIPLSQDCCQVISTFTALYCISFHGFLSLRYNICHNCCQLIQPLGSLYACQWHGHNLLKT